jgi:hypothetical protein
MGLRCGRSIEVREFQTLGEWHDYLVWLSADAPDRFLDYRSLVLVQDQPHALREAFARLRSGIHFVRTKLKDERLSRIAEEMIEMSFEAYVQGDSETGAHTLLECEGLIWPSQRRRVKHAVEAERRAFGKNLTYAGVSVSPYPREGSSADLGADQATLLNLAYRHFRSYQRAQKHFKYFSWIIDNAGVVRRTSIEPREDQHPALQPVQRSRGYKRLKELGRSGQIRACVLMGVIAPLESGAVFFDLEQLGRCCVRVSQTFKRTANGFQYADMTFYLLDPDIFPAAD